MTMNDPAQLESVNKPLWAKLDDMCNLMMTWGLAFDLFACESKINRSTSLTYKWRFACTHREEIAPLDESDPK